jgi:hypothetical protein
MRETKAVGTAADRLSAAGVVLLGAMVCVPLTGCIAVGYTSGGGWFMWPGGLGLLLLIAIVLFVLRRR